MPLSIYWASFLNAFKRELSETCDDDFRKAWTSSRNRTQYYEENLLRKVAQALGLSFKKEEFKIDYTLCHSEENGYEVPVIFIESENIASSAHHEIRKLCCLHAPLKVLIVCAEWSTDPGSWSHGGQKDKLLSDWSLQIKAHNKIWPSPNFTGIIVAEWNQQLKYYSVAFNHLGEIADDHQVLFERTVR